MIDQSQEHRELLRPICGPEKQAYFDDVDHIDIGEAQVTLTVDADAAHWYADMLGPKDESSKAWRAVAFAIEARTEDVPDEIMELKQLIEEEFGEKVHVSVGRMSELPAELRELLEGAEGD